MYTQAINNIQSGLYRIQQDRTASLGAFDQVLAREQRSAQVPATGAPVAQHTKRLEQALAAARQLVADAFIKPILARQMQDPFRTPLFHGGFAEDAFQSQLNQIFADRIVSKAGFSIVEAVYQQITPSGTKVNIDEEGPSKESQAT